MSSANDMTSDSRASTRDCSTNVRTLFALNDRARCDFVGEQHEEGVMPMRQLVVIGAVLLSAACGGPQSPPATPAAEPSAAVQLGGPPTGAGTSTADTGEIKPADPTT